jgi:hypothetical protein
MSWLTISVGFVEDKVTLGCGSVCELLFHLLVPSYQCPILIRSSAAYDMQVTRSN